MEQPPPNKPANAGRFPKGKSGNPSGRPKIPTDIREACKVHTPAAVGVLAKGLKSKDERVAVVCAEALLNRAWGKPTQAHSGPDGGPIPVAAVVAHVDLRKQLRGLTDDDLAALDRITAKLALPAPAASAGGSGGSASGDSGGEGSPVG